MRTYSIPLSPWYKSKLEGGTSPLGHHWATIGPPLDHIWATIGPYLGHHWAIFGPPLGHIWATIGIGLGNRKSDLWRLHLVYFTVVNVYIVGSASRPQVSQNKVCCHLMAYHIISCLVKGMPSWKSNKRKLHEILKNLRIPQSFLSYYYREDICLFVHARMNLEWALHSMNLTTASWSGPTLILAVLMGNLPWNVYILCIKEVTPGFWVNFRWCKAFFGRGYSPY